MPLSLPYNIHQISETVWRHKPKSIVDVGCGFGKYGVIFREYLDVMECRLKKKDWQYRIDAVEVFKDYITPIHQHVYNNIYIGDITKGYPWPADVQYEMMFLGDVIEHFTLADAITVIDNFKGKWILISTPIAKCASINCNDKFVRRLGNKHEQHVYEWLEEDFHSLKNWAVKWMRGTDCFFNFKNRKKRSTMRTVFLERR